MNRGKNSLVSQASQPISTSTRTCARVRLGELLPACDTRDGAGVLRQMFTPMKGEVAISPEAYSPVAVTCSVHALVFKSDMTGQTSRQPPIPSHSYRC